MPKNPTAALPAVLPVPSPLDWLLRAKGFESELVIRRTDGKPMSAEDRQSAETVVRESQEYDRSDDEIADEVMAELAARAASAKRTKRPAPAAARMARAPTEKRAASR